MAGKKRPLDGEAVTSLEHVHASRKKRVKYTEEDAQLADIYNNLADEVPSVRIEAAGALLKNLGSKLSSDPHRLEVTETRLIRGLCSGRKAARLGFSIALTEIFRLRFSEKSGALEESNGLKATTDRIVKLTTPEGNVSGQERRDHLLGRRFAFQALLQSDVGLNNHLPDEQWQHLIQSIFVLASQKKWLRQECGAMLHDFLMSPNAPKLSAKRVRTIVDELVSAKLEKTTEGVGLWLVVQHRFPEVKLPKHVWHHRDPLASKELPVLSKALLETPTDDEPSTKISGSRQSTLGFAWTVILREYFERRDEDKFANFWETVVASTMFSSKSSAERRALGLQVLTLAISMAPAQSLTHVMSSQNVINCILDQRSSPERYLFDAAKVPLNEMVSQGKQSPELTATLVEALLRYGHPNFDQITKSKTMESLISAANEDALHQIVLTVSKHIEETSPLDRSRVENHRRMLADLLLNAIRSHQQSGTMFLDRFSRGEPRRLALWAILLLDRLVSFGYKRQDPSLMNPMTSEASQAVFRARLMSCLGCFLEHPIGMAVMGPLHVINSLSSTNHLSKDLSQDQRGTVSLATKIVNERKQQNSDNATMLAFRLLLSLCVVQVYNEESDSLTALEDLILCYQNLGNGEDAATMLIELLLSFISKPSGLFRKLAEQVFSVFAGQLTAESLQSLIDILRQKESLSGQQALFNQAEEDDPRPLPGPPGSDEGIDMEDASDVELVNGQELSASSSEADEDEEGSADNSSGAGEEAPAVDVDDEGAAFDKKLSDALGTAGLEDSDDDGSDMDDEQMMALEPHLASIFKERAKTTSKKQESKEAKENIVNFKNRVLDLLMIFVKSEYSNVLTLDLILPLTTLVRTTTSKASAEKAFTVLKQYYDACNKNKSLPQPDDHEACFEVLSVVHEEMKLGGSKLHANACSRASLFLSKVLVALDRKYYERIAGMYAQLQSEWYLHEKSKIPSSVFTEWTSWSINTRKHA